MSCAKVSASIVVYGDFEEAAKTVSSVLAYTKGVALQLFVIDNASPGTTGAQLQAAFGTQCTVLQLEKNLGFGKGHNACLPLLDSEFHFVINPDITLQSDVLTEMAQYLQAHPDVAMATPAMRFPDGRAQHTAKRKPTFLGLLARQLPGKMLAKHETHYLMLDEDLSAPREVEFCSGCFFAMRTQVFCGMGGFDPAYFMYVEDADITQKALQYGKAVFLPQFFVTHAWHRDARRKVKNFVWQIRSMLRYWHKWGFRWR